MPVNTDNTGRVHREELPEPVGAPGGHGRDGAQRLGDLPARAAPGDQLMLVVSGAVSGRSGI
jgi:hypothetical protein